ncbi:hypothetical protein [Janthinobacterium sp. PC23-8]|uniref:hypothetical protein n=1 Tax=Janthinobacterium sp. PC23-8 TaxID=2012679 RepID=UPI000B9747AA|nr:hypothetical protein [Janthinobacterium sp. PC23-8]OYO29821.1 hypothetical protein CD932_00700 [Janthinobacterium sp. PC23-8]
MPEAVTYPIHPALARYTCRSTRQYNHLLTTSVTRNGPTSTMLVNNGYGNATLHQTTSTYTDQQIVGSVAQFYALFENDSKEQIEFRIASLHSVTPGEHIYLLLEKQFWLFQLEKMSEPRVVFGHLPEMGNCAPYLSVCEQALRLSDPESQQRIKLALFPLKDYLAGIGKGTPRTFLGTGRLEEVLSESKARASDSYSNASWPRWRRDSHERANFPDNVLWPILKYKAVNAATTLSPQQMVRGQLSRTWMTSGLVLGSLAFFADRGTVVQQIYRALNMQTPVYFHFSLTVILLQWLIWVIVALLLTMIFISPASKRPFKFDEEQFYRIVNKPYHREARVGFEMKGSFYDAIADDKALISDTELENRRLLAAHNKFDFFYKSHEEFVEKLKSTKLNDEEKQRLLMEIEQFRHPY